MRIIIDELFIFCCSLYDLRLGVAFFPRPLGCKAKGPPLKSVVIGWEVR